MDIFVFGREQWGSIEAKIRGFGNDILRLLRASPVFGSAVCATGIVLGAAPMVWAKYFGRFVDGCFASRGVGVMTTDLTHSALILMGTTIAMFVAGGYFLQTRALSRAVATTIAVGILIATQSFIIFPIEKSFLLFLLVLALGIRVAKHRAVVAMIGAVLLFITFSTIADVLTMMTHRSMTVGSALEYCLVILTLSATTAAIAFHYTKESFSIDR